MNTELQKYIQTALQSGNNPNELRNSLKKAGWSESAINASWPSLLHMYHVFIERAFCLMIALLAIGSAFAVHLFVITK